MNAGTHSVRGTAKQLNGQKDKLLADVRTVVADAEDLLRKVKSTGAERYAALREELEDKLADTIVRLQEVQEELTSRARRAAAYVHENPWKSMGVVVAAGIVIALVLSRR
jgi:ElaB/YqjD/DUF883 family membrane-anchored ribosome-binding protein